MGLKKKDVENQFNELRTQSSGPVTRVRGEGGFPLALAFLQATQTHFGWSM